MDRREMSNGGSRQRSSQEQTRREEETQLLNGEAEHLEKITAHIEWKGHLEVMKVKVLEQINNQLSDLLDKTLEEAAHSRPQQLNMVPEKKQSREKEELLKKKVFVPQRSLVDTLLEVEHFRTIHHIFVAMLCIFVLKQISVDSIDEGRLVLDFDLFIVGFRQLPTALFAWLCMFLYTLFVPYQALQIWSDCLKMTRFPNLLTSTLVLLMLICHIAVLFIFPICIVVYCNLGIASRIIVLMEQIRLLMKSYSFLRESMPPLLRARYQVGNISPPEFSTYLYFLFCPILIYRQSYPRDPYIRWSYAIQKLVEFMACISILHFLMKYHFIPHGINMHKQPFNIKVQLLAIFDLVVPGITLLLMIFYFILDCWPNMFAEILCFADRSFYKVMTRAGEGCKKDMGSHSSWIYLIGPLAMKHRLVEFHIILYILSVMECDSVKGETWDSYVARFDCFLISNGYTEISRDRKRSYFLGFCGTEMFETARALFSPTSIHDVPWQEFLSMLQDHYAPVPSCCARRYKFYHWSQLEGESINDCIAALRCVALYCEFDNLEDYLLDRLVFGIKDGRLKRRLLAVQDLTFKAALTEARAFDLSTQSLAAMDGSVNATSAVSGASSSQLPQEIEKALESEEEVCRLARSRNRDPATDQQKPPPSPCQGCGGDHFHLSFPFKEAFCRRCGGRGHIACVDNLLRRYLASDIRVSS
ncbi:sterol O-acyltransferase 2-like [Erythrolamprus reginae]|uniref:sterol O-acyltransferase 2-like n=1 Tax=Erythrolamprus reginae TaxID=121349 RepID=UPI00396C9E1C